MIYVKSFLTGLAAVFLTAIVLIAREWSSEAFMVARVDGSRIAEPVLVASFVVFAVGFSWQYLRS